MREPRRPRISTTLVRLSALALAMKFGAPALAQSDPPGVHREAFAIRMSAQPLGSALTELANQTGLLIGVDASLVRGKQAPALRGRYTPEQALRILLSGTGLTFGFTGSDTVTLERLTSRSENSGPVELGTITVEGAGELPDPSVTPIDGYKADASITGSRIPLAIKETPGSVGVVTDDYIRDKAVRDVNDALEQISGAAKGNRRMGRAEDFLVRGFSVDDGFSGLRVDGLPANSTGLGTFTPDPAVIERIEVLKGPASIAGGSSSPGGVINIITKKPQPENFAAPSFEAGSFDLYRGVLDLNGYVSSENDVRGRLIATYEDGGNFVDTIDERQYVIAPSVEADFFDGAGTLLLSGQYQNFDGEAYPGIPLLVNGEVPDVPPERFVGGQGLRTEFEDRSLGAEYDHRFVNDLKLSIKGRYGNSDHISKDIYAYTYYGAALNGETDIYAGLRDIDADTYAGEIFLGKTIDAFDQEHDLLLGVDHRDQTRNFLLGFKNLGTDNLFDPSNDLIAPPDDVLRAVSNQPRREMLEQSGLFGQAVIRPLDALTVLLAGRQDWASTELLDKLTDEVRDNSFSEFTGRAGFSYEVTPLANLYASYSESFTPQVFNVAVGNVPLPPETGQQYEAGLKLDLLDGELSVTSALFRIDRQNTAANDVGNQGFSIAVGEQRHQGVELDVNGELFAGLRANFNYSFVDAEIVEDAEGGNVGNRPQYVPKHRGSVWLIYEMQAGLLQGLGVGGGVYVQDEVPIENANNAFVPGYERVDLTLAYRETENLELQFTVRNLLDAEYIEHPGTFSGYNNFGAPLSIFGTLTYRFD